MLATVNVVAGARVAVGAVTRTGSVVLMVLDGVGSAPGFSTRREFGLLPDDMPAQPYHLAADLELSDGEDLVSKVERGAEEAAAAGLRAMAGQARAQAADSRRARGAADRGYRYHGRSGDAV